MMTADETHRMGLPAIFSASRQLAEATGRAAIVESTARGMDQVVIVNADPVALALERRKLEKQKGDARRMRRERGE